MSLANLFSNQLAFFDLDVKERDDVFNIVADKLLTLNLINSKEIFVSELIKRENEDSTGIGDGIAIPHILNKIVAKPAIIFVRTKEKIGWNALDGNPINLIFLIMTSGHDGNEHLEALANLSKVLMVEDNINKIGKIKTIDELTSICDSSLKKLKNDKVVSTNKNYDVVGITACPTGIAHTYLAQDKIIEYAKKLGLTAKIETQGRRGTEDKLSQEEIDNAKIIILAHDKSLTGLGRFNGKKVVDTHTKDVIFNGEQVIKNALAGENLIEIKSTAKDDSDSELSLKKFKDIKGNLLAGVSRMLPFVVGGGILLGIAFLIDFATGAKGGGTFGTNDKTAGWFAALGKLSMQMMIPILGGYICYSIVGPQGLLCGVVAGLASSNIMPFAYGANDGWSNMWGKLLPFESHESGFIGAIFGAYLAALIIFGWSKLMQKMPRGLQGARDIVFIPVLSLLCTGVAMFAINIPLGYFMMELGEGIKWLANNNLILLVSAISGLLMCVDMGGPINKIAYSIGTLAVGGQLIKGSDGLAATGALLGQQQILMASSLLAGMLPPLMIAICTVIFPKSWTSKDKDAAKVNWIMGACFVTEGAIPFMIKDPKRIGISAMIGGLLSGLVVGALKISVGAPHGGIFVFALMQSGLGNSNYELTSRSITIGIISAIAILIAFSTLSAFILGIWRTADIKKGSLILDESNGVKERIEAKLVKLNNQHHENANIEERRIKKIDQVNAALSKYNNYLDQLQEKQAVWLQKNEQRKMLKAKK